MSRTVPEWGASASIARDIVYSVRLYANLYMCICNTRYVHLLIGASACLL